MPVADASTLPSKLQACDQALLEVGRKIRVLNAISWPAALEARFLEGWRGGNPRLPEPRWSRSRTWKRSPRSTPSCASSIAAIRSATGCTRARGASASPRACWRRSGSRASRAVPRCCTGDPTVRYPARTPAMPTPPATCCGSPTTCSAASGWGAALRHPAEEFAERLRQRMGGFFTQDKVQVVLDPALASKATAGSTKVRIRAGALFSEADLEQLLEHEAYIHTATLLNGKHQPVLRSLGVGAPRTTRTQEGLATFAEIVTGAMDIARLRRIALRVMMVERALQGADFVEVFKGFLAAGQTEVESYRSAARVFRGGDVRGGVCFTKDGAYLEGVFSIQLFIRKALQDGRGHLLPMLFVGRVTTGDVLTLEPFLASGLIHRATYVPPWAREPHRILALMAYSAGAQRFRADTFALDRFAEGEDEQIAEAGRDY
jgi:hypothetical protein